MTKYIIKPGIAALVEVGCDKFPDNLGRTCSSFIYMAEGKRPEKGCGDPVKWEDLPPQVQDAITTHFATVFSLPVERRGDYLKRIDQMEIEV